MDSLNQPGLARLQRRPMRVSTTIPWGTYQRLLRQSDEQGRSLSNWCAVLLENGSLGADSAAPIRVATRAVPLG